VIPFGSLGLMADREGTQVANLCYENREGTQVANLCYEDREGTQVENLCYERDSERDTG